MNVLKNTTSADVYWAAVRSDVYVFMQQAFLTIYPGKALEPNWHIEAIVAALEDSIQGKAPRLIINLPPRNLKSFLISVALPAFILGANPSAKIICVSYSDELARNLSREFKRIVDSAWFRKVFPNGLFTKTTETECATDQGGSRFATSVGGTLTGRGADFIIIDDPIKPDDARSDTSRAKVNEWYRSTLLSRLDDKLRSVLIIVMQRLHVNDLTGYAEAAGGFKKLSFAAIATANETISLRFGEQKVRYEGEPLQEQREGLKILEQIKDQMGPLNFSSQYQQKPETPDGAMFKRKWFQFLPKAPRIEARGSLYVSIDSALSTSETADYSAISLLLAQDQKYYVLSAERGRWDYETLRAKTMAYRQKFGDRLGFLIEAAGTGVSLLNYLQSQHPQLTRFSYRPRTDKQTRAAYAVPIFADGRVHIIDEPGKNDWVEPYINEFVTFPHGRFDDQVDSLTQILPWLDGRHRGSGSCIIG